jgi:hypothetical protein
MVGYSPVLVAIPLVARKRWSIGWGARRPVYLAAVTKSAPSSIAWWHQPDLFKEAPTTLWSRGWLWLTIGSPLGGVLCLFSGYCGAPLQPRASFRNCAGLLMRLSSPHLQTASKFSVTSQNWGLLGQSRHGGSGFGPGHPGASVSSSTAPPVPDPSGAFQPTCHPASSSPRPPRHPGLGSTVAAR